MLNSNLKKRNRRQEPPHTSARQLSFYHVRIGQPYVIRTHLAPERDPGAQQAATALTLLLEIFGWRLDIRIDSKASI